MSYRVGRSLGRTVYRGDRLIGMMDTAADAALVVEALNKQPHTSWPTEHDPDCPAYLSCCTCRPAAPP